jgi:serine/threonine protein kinase
VIPTDAQIAEYLRDHPRRKTIESFENIGQIGCGAFGKVFIVKERDTRIQCALKIISKRQIRTMQDFYQVKNEREILEQVSGYNFLPELYWAFEDDESFYFAMKSLKSDLFERMAVGLDWTRDQKRFMMAELVLALERLHEMNIVFGDLKLENVMFDERGHVILTDFGLSGVLPPGVEYTERQAGTLEYMAPELFNDPPEYGKPIDFWAFGLVYYEVMSGSSYFKLDNRSIADFGVYLKSHEIAFKSVNMQEEDITFCYKLVKKEKAFRLTNWQNVKQSEAFKGIDWDKVAKKQYSIPPPTKELELSPGTFHTSMRPLSKFYLARIGFHNFYYSFRDK